MNAATNDVFIGEYVEGKRAGRGRQLYCAKGEIYDGEWSNDKRQGEGTVLNARGEVCSGEFRADLMEGKLTYQRTLNEKETDRVFNFMRNCSDSFIAVSKEMASTPMRSLVQSRMEQTTT